MGTWSDITYVWNTLGYPFPVGAHGVLLGEGLKRMVSRQSPNDLTTKTGLQGRYDAQETRPNKSVLGNYWWCGSTASNHTNALHPPANVE